MRAMLKFGLIAGYAIDKYIIPRGGGGVVMILDASCSRNLCGCLGHLWVGLGHLWVGLGYLWVGLGYLWVGLGYLWVGLGHLVPERLLKAFHHVIARHFTYLRGLGLKRC